MYLARNLLYYRKNNKLSRSQAAAALDIPASLLSQWENGQAEPEAAMLPRLARVYHVTIDDLFTRRSSAYEHYAHRLGAAFDATRTPEDFLHADAAFRQLIEQGEATAEDLRLYANLQQTMADCCLENAMALYARITASAADPADPAVCTARRQHMHLLIRLGRTTPELEAYLKELTESSGDPEEWLALLAVFQESGREAEALDLLRLARRRFPNNAMICYWGGTICQSRGQWEEALAYWEEALKLDPDFTDAAYACAECREQLGNLQGAWSVWNSLTRTMELQGLSAEAVYPRQQAKRLHSMIS